MKDFLNAHLLSTLKDLNLLLETIKVKQNGIYKNIDRICVVI